MDNENGYYMIKVTCLQSKSKRLDNVGFLFSIRWQSRSERCLKNTHKIQSSLNKDTYDFMVCSHWLLYGKKTCNSDSHFFKTLKSIENVWWNVFQTERVVFKISENSKSISTVITLYYNSRFKKCMNSSLCMIRFVHYDTWILYQDVHHRTRVGCWLTCCLKCLITIHQFD